MAGNITISLSSDFACTEGLYNRLQSSQRLIALDNGALVVCYSIQKITNFRRYVDYRVKISFDNGITWSELYSNSFFESGEDIVGFCSLATDGRNVFFAYQKYQTIRVLTLEIDAGSVTTVSRQSNEIIALEGFSSITDLVMDCVKIPTSPFKKIFVAASMSYSDIPPAKNTDVFLRELSVEKDGTLGLWGNLEKLTGTSSTIRLYGFSARYQANGEVLAVIGIEDTNAQGASLYFCKKTGFSQSGNGILWSRSSIVSQAPATYHGQPTLKIMSDKNIVVSWITGSVLRVAAFNEGYTFLTSVFDVASGTASRAQILELEQVQGKALVVYSHDNVNSGSSYRKARYVTLDITNKIVSTATDIYAPNVTIDIVLTVQNKPFACLTPPCLIYGTSAAILVFQWQNSFIKSGFVRPNSSLQTNLRFYRASTKNLFSYVIKRESDGTAIQKIVERVNGVDVNTYLNPVVSTSGTTFNFSVSDEVFDSMTFYKENDVEIEVTQGYADATQIVKNVYFFKIAKVLSTSAGVLETAKAIKDDADRLEEMTRLLNGNLSGFNVPFLNFNLLSTSLEKLKKKSSRWAMGQTTAGASTLNFELGTGSQFESKYYLNVTGLEFTPSFVIAFRRGLSYDDIAIFNSLTFGTPKRNALLIANTSSVSMYDARVYARAKSFILPTMSQGTYDWLAFE